MDTNDYHLLSQFFPEDYGESSSDEEVKEEEQLINQFFSTYESDKGEARNFFLEKSLEKSLEREKELHKEQTEINTYIAAIAVASFLFGCITTYYHTKRK